LGGLLPVSKLELADATATDPEAVRRAATEFARRALNDRVGERDRAGEFSIAAWRACAAFGVQGLPLPQRYGGSGADLRTVIAVMQGLGLGSTDNGLLFSLNAQLWSVELPILTFGSPDQRERYLPGLASGERIGAHAMSEPGSGSDAFSLQTRAERSGDDYVLNGRKSFSTNAPVADLAVVFATIDPSLGAAGVTAFIVERGTPGFAVTREEDKMGMRTSPMGELTLDGCRVASTQRLGPEGAGSTIFNSSMEWERAAILSVAVGAMERELVRVLDYANVRKQFRQPIARFPAVANRIADMKVRLDAARGLLDRVAVRVDAGKQAALEAAIAKLFISEAWVQSSLDAQQIYGAYGYLRENGIEREVRDAIASRIYSGTSDLQRLIIARLIGS
jgi:hypothetical protein